MAIDPKFAAALALQRFGFGPAPGAIAATADDPRGALLAELERPFKPTDLRALFKGLLADHLSADARMLAADVFPGSEQIRPMAGLVVSI
jgi:uncharacterized protein (DUF1501 family)